MADQATTTVTKPPGKEEKSGPPLIDIVLVALLIGAGVLVTAFVIRAIVEKRALLDPEGDGVSPTEPSGPNPSANGAGAPLVSADEIDEILAPE